METNTTEASTKTNQSTSTEQSQTIHAALSYSLDSLARCSLDELAALYRDAKVPSTVRVTDGALRGRMLAVRGVPAVIAEPLRRWAASRSFVWEGKTFTSASDHHGVGHNRVYIPGLFGRQNLFPFETLLAPSVIDDKPTMILDYDLEANPGYIRHIHDEIREIEPGLYLGPAMWKAGDKKTLILWFALDARAS